MATDDFNVEMDDSDSEPVLAEKETSCDKIMHEEVVVGDEGDFVCWRIWEDSYDGPKLPRYSISTDYASTESDWKEGIIEGGFTVRISTHHSPGDIKQLKRVSQAFHNLAEAMDKIVKHVEMLAEKDDLE